MLRSRQLALLPISAVLLLVSGRLAQSQSSDVLTFHNDNARSGQVVREWVLTPATVTASNFGKLMNVVLDGKVDAQPLQVSHVGFPGINYANVVYAATEHDSVYAFDANTGRMYWHVSLLGSGETTSDTRGCGQVTPEIGITSTPVIDPSAGPNGTIYVVAMSKNGSGAYFQRLHALDLVTGVEEFGGPVAVQASVPSSGPNSVGGQVVFDAKQYKDRAALLLVNGVVYTSWGSHCDINPYTGWIIGYDQQTLKQTSVFNFVPNGTEGALWNSGAGPAADSAGNIFASVANGTFDSTLTAQGFPTKGDYGNAFIKLGLSNRQLTAADYWTMYNSNSESSHDTDLGSGGFMLLPDLTDASGAVRHLAVGAGKDTNLYVIDRDNMGKYDATSDATIYQQLTGALPGGVFSSPAYYTNYVYFGPLGSSIQSFTVANAKLAASSATSHTFGYPGATPSISASGGSNGILWVAENTNPAVLHAYDANNLTREFYSSSQAANGRDNFGAGNKYIVPTIANGEVFVGTQNSVAVFSPLPALPLPNGQYTVTGQLSMLVLDDPGFNTSPGTQIIQWDLNAGPNQKWLFTGNGNGYYTIKNVWSNLYLACPSGSTSNGTPLAQLAADGSDSQLFSLSTFGSGYVITNKASGLVVDDSGFSVQRGAGMQFWVPLGNSNQAWLIH